MKTILKTLKVRVKDNRKNILNRMAFEINQVWNAANQETAENSWLPIPEAGWVRNNISAFDLQKQLKSIKKERDFIVGAVSNINFISIVSTAATVRFLKFYDQDTVPNVGTDIPTHTFAISVGSNPLQAPPLGFNFTTGFAYAIMLGAEDDNSTPFAANNEVFIMMEYT
jgi:hypothetical protein